MTRAAPAVEQPHHLHLPLPHELPHLPDPAHAFGLDAQEAPTLLGQRLLDSIGGKRGVVDGALPTIVFATGNVAAGLTAGLIAAGALGVVLTVVRLARREPVRQALSGLVALGVACAWALHAHKATAFYLPGILVTGGIAVVIIGSIVVRRPLIGVVAGLCVRDFVGWRSSRRLRRAMDLATAMWGLFYAASFGVRLAFYETGHATTLAALRLALGYPSTLALIGLSVLIARAAANGQTVGGAIAESGEVVGALKSSSS